MSEHSRGYMRRCFKMGGSIGITLPHWFVVKHGLTSGSEVGILETDSKLEINCIGDTELIKHLQAMGGSGYIQSKAANHTKKVVIKSDSKKQIKPGGKK